MENNIINLISNNTFIKKLYPNGITNFFIGNIILNIDNSIMIDMHSIDEPNIEIPKWGKWNKDYNVVVIELSAHAIAHCNIQNWQTVNKLPYKLEINNGENENYEFKFSNGETNIYIETDWFLFQRCSTYIVY